VFHQIRQTFFPPNFPAAIWYGVICLAKSCSVCEMGNVHDLYAIGVVKMGTGTVGHLPKKISMPCHLYFIYDHSTLSTYLNLKNI